MITPQNILATMRAGFDKTNLMSAAEVDISAALGETIQDLLLAAYTYGFGDGVVAQRDGRIAGGSTVGSTAEAAQATPPDSGSTPDSSTNYCAESRGDHCGDYEATGRCCFCGMES